MVIIFIGPPGSGKGTQAQILKDNFLPNLHLLTVSSLLKEKSDDGSMLGNDIKKKSKKEIFTSSKISPIFEDFLPVLETYIKEILLESDIENLVKDGE